MVWCAAFRAPTVSSTPSMPAGPMTCRSAAARTRTSARAAATISGPMPRGSPTETASRGRGTLTLATARAGESLLLGGRLLGRERQRVLANGDVRPLPQGVHQALDAALLGEARPEALLPLGQRQLPALFHRRELGDDELARHRGIARNLEHHEILGLLVGERRLVGRGQLCARERR